MMEESGAADSIVKEGLGQPGTKEYNTKQMNPAYRDVGKHMGLGCLSGKYAMELPWSFLELNSKKLGESESG